MAKGNLLKNMLTYGMFSFLTLSSLFPLKTKAETILDKTYSVEFVDPQVLSYGKNKPTTNVKVKVDLDNAGENEYNLGISFYAKGWNEKKNNFLDYVLIYGPGSRICLAHSKNISIDNPEEKVYFVKRANARNKNLDCFEEKVYPLEESRNIRMKMKIIENVTDLLTLFMGKAVHYISDMGEFRMTGAESAREIFRKIGKENVAFSEIPFYPHNFRNVTARKFDIPVYIRKKGEKDIVYVSLNINLVGGPSNNESYGSLENLMIEVPLR